MICMSASKKGELNYSSQCSTSETDARKEAAGQLAKKRESEVIRITCLCDQLHLVHMYM